ncbi:MAG TPA: methyltransferase domain-containing protein [Candidatus Acidoferrum sp.]
MQPDQDIINRWTGSAPHWEKHREVIRHMFAPVSEALIDAAQIKPGDTVLDVATGPGEPALTVAAHVGATGNVVGIDPIPDMVAAARREAQRRGLQNAQFEVAFADQLPFPEAHFDAAICRFGAMFFPAPVDAIRELLRVLKPGKKLVFAVWSFAENNPFHHALSRVIDCYVEVPPADPDAADAFRYAQPGKLLKFLNQAGAIATSECLQHFTIEAPVSVEDYWTLRREMSEKLNEKITNLPAHLSPKVKNEMLAALREYASGPILQFPAEILLVSGIKAA